MLHLRTLYLYIVITQLDIISIFYLLFLLIETIMQGIYLRIELTSKNPPKQSNKGGFN